MLSSLRQVLEEILPRACLLIAQTRVRQLNRRRPFDRVVVQAFDWRFLHNYHAFEAPELVLGALGRKAAGRLAGWTRRAPRVPASSAGKPPPRWRGAITACHTRGLKVWAWTFSSRKRPDSLLSAGIDGVISNVPAVMQRLIAGSAASGNL